MGCASDADDARGAHCRKRYQSSEQKPSTQAPVTRSIKFTPQHPITPSSSNLQLDLVQLGLRLVSTHHTFANKFTQVGSRKAGPFLSPRGP